MKKTVIITGGTAGIGKATALKFAQNGFNIVTTSRSEEKANKFMLKQPTKGKIVNLASIAGLNGIEYGGEYGATKHAVVGMTKGAAVEHATSGITINAVAPGSILTDILNDVIASGSMTAEELGTIHPMKRTGTVEDIANAIYFLSSDECPFMTGVILPVDGGYTAR